MFEILKNEFEDPDEKSKPEKKNIIPKEHVDMMRKNSWTYEDYMEWKNR